MSTDIAFPCGTPGGGSTEYPGPRRQCRNTTPVSPGEALDPNTG